MFTIRIKNKDWRPGIIIIEKLKEKRNKKLIYFKIFPFLGVTIVQVRFCQLILHLSSVSYPGVPVPYSMAFWIRIRIRNTDLGSGT